MYYLCQERQIEQWNRIDNLAYALDLWQKGTVGHWEKIFSPRKVVGSISCIYGKNKFKNKFWQISWKSIPGGDLQSKLDRQNNKTFGG